MSFHEHDKDDPWTYFGLYSSKDVHLASNLLKSLNVRFNLVQVEESEEILKKWKAWDSMSSNPKTAHCLWIHDSDISKVGNRLVDLFAKRESNSN